LMSGVCVTLSQSASIVSDSSRYCKQTHRSARVGPRCSGGESAVFLDALTEGANDASASDGADAGNVESDGGAGQLCSLYEGPVSSCDAGAAAGPVQRCTSVTPVCTPMASPGWACCNTAHLQTCAWLQFDDASCM
jgi:hypothetical protein